MMLFPKQPSDRRTFSPEFKWNIVQQAKAKKQSISVIARQHDVNNNQVFRWLREVDDGKVLWVRRAKAVLQGETGEVTSPFLPVSVVSQTPTPKPVVNCKGLTVEFRSGHRLILNDLPPSVLEQLVVALA